MYLERSGARQDGRVFCVGFRLAQRRFWYGEQRATGGPHGPAWKGAYQKKRAASGPPVGTTPGDLPIRYQLVAAVLG